MGDTAMKILALVAISLLLTVRAEAASPTGSLLQELAKTREALLPEIHTILEIAKPLQPAAGEQWPINVIRFRYKATGTQLTTFSAAVFRWPNRVDGHIRVAVLQTDTAVGRREVRRKYKDPVRAQVSDSLGNILNHAAMSDLRRTAEKAAAARQLWVASTLTEVGDHEMAWRSTVLLSAVCPRYPNLQLCQVTASIRARVRHDRN
jgi:hypothetical protein